MEKQKYFSLLNYATIVLVGLFVTSFLYFFSVFDGYKHITRLTLINLGVFENVLFLLQFSFILLFIAYTYALCKEFLSYGDIYKLSGLSTYYFFYAVAVIFTFVIIPGFIYMHGMMAFVGIFVMESPDLSQVAPNYKFSDFWVSCMEGSDESLPKNIPPMNGHIVAAGVHPDGKSYVCVDVSEAFKRLSKDLPMSEKGLKAFQYLASIPDVVCSGLENRDIPPSNQSKTN